MSYIQTELEKFKISDSMIARLAEDYLPLKINGLEDKEGYATVHASRMIVKCYRIQVEKRRKELTADALTFQRAINSEARRITDLLEPIENYLEAQEKVIDEEKARIKKEKEDKERAILQEKLEKERQELIAKEKAARDAEEQRLREIKEQQEAQRLILEKQAKEQEAIAKMQADKESELKRFEESLRTKAPAPIPIDTIESLQKPSNSLKDFKVTIISANEIMCPCCGDVVVISCDQSATALGINKHTACNSQ